MTWPNVARYTSGAFVGFAIALWSPQAGSVGGGLIFAVLAYGLYFWTELYEEGSK